MTTNLLSVIEQLQECKSLADKSDKINRPLIYGRVIDKNFDAVIAALAAAQQVLEQPQGEWKHCSPELLASGVSCKDAPRRPCECEHGGSHDHWITHPQATEPAPSTPAEAHDQTKNLRIQRLGSTFFVAQTETEATMSVSGLSEPAPSTAGERMCGFGHESCDCRTYCKHPAQPAQGERAEAASGLRYEWKYYAENEGANGGSLARAIDRAAALLSAPALPAAAMQLADDFAAAAVNHYSAGENDKELWQKMADARQALETKLMEVK